MISILSEYSRRPIRAPMVDGLADIAMGLGCLYAALQWYSGILMVTAVRQASSLQERLAINHRFDLIDIALCLLISVINLTLIPIRHRFVYPRIGYVSLGCPKDHRILRPIGMILVTALASGSWFGLMMWILHNDSWSSVQRGNMIMMGFGAAFAIIFDVLYLQFGFVRHLVIAGISIVTVVLLINIPIDSRYYLLLFFLVLMIVTMAAGINAFMKILRIPVATQQDVE